METGEDTDKGSVFNQLVRSMILFFEGDLFNREYPIAIDRYKELLNETGFETSSVTEIEGVPDAVIKAKKIN